MWIATGTGKSSGLLEIIFSLAHIEEITLGEGEEVDQVAGGASGMGDLFNFWYYYHLSQILITVH